MQSHLPEEHLVITRDKSIITQVLRKYKNPRFNLQSPLNIQFQISLLERWLCILLLMNAKAWNLTSCHQLHNNWEPRHCLGASGSRGYTRSLSPSYSQRYIMTEMKLIVYISVQVHVHLNYVTCEIKIWMLAEICHFKIPKHLLMGFYCIHTV